MRRRRSSARIVGYSAIILVLLVSGILATTFFMRSSNLLPKQVLDSANFTIFLPKQAAKNDDAWNLVASSVGYDKTSGVLSSSYKQESSEITITLTEQSTPDAFTDVPQQYSHVLSALNEYAELQTSFGTVGLTHPKELNGRQSAVINKSGTLMFAKPSGDLTNDEWKRFFETLQIIR